MLYHIWYHTIYMISYHFHDITYDIIYDIIHIYRRPILMVYAAVSLQQPIFPVLPRAGVFQHVWAHRADSGQCHAASWSAHALWHGQQRAPAALPLHLLCRERAGASTPLSVLRRRQVTPRFHTASRTISVLVANLLTCSGARATAADSTRSQCLDVALQPGRRGCVHRWGGACRRESGASVSVRAGSGRQRRGSVATRPGPLLLGLLKAAAERIEYSGQSLAYDIIYEINRESRMISCAISCDIIILSYHLGHNTATVARLPWSHLGTWDLRISGYLWISPDISGYPWISRISFWPSRELIRKQGYLS